MLERVVAVNEKGLRIGEDHPKARLTNHEIDMLLEMREQGLSYGRLSAIWEISKSAVRYICNGRMRCQTAVDWRQVAGAHADEKAA